MELTAGRRIGRGRDTALQHNPVHLRIGIRNRDRREQCLRIGMQRIFEYILRIPVLHQIAQIHNAHRVRDMLHHTQIVRDKQVSQFVLLL